MTADQLNKMRNTLIFLANSVYDPGMTKLLKLLFFCEEYSVRKHCKSFFGLDFYAWQMGPVERTTYTNLANLKPGEDTRDSNIFAGYFEYFDNGPYKLLRTDAHFDDGEFSDNDMQILHEVTERFRSATAKELIDLTHRPGSLWYNTVLKEPGLMKMFNTKEQRDSNLVLDFTEILEKQEQKTFYLHSKEMQGFIDSLKA